MVGACVEHAGEAVAELGELVGGCLGYELLESIEERFDRAAAAARV